jgi:hypothetical protein
MRRSVRRKTMGPLSATLPCYDDDAHHRLSSLPPSSKSRTTNFGRLVRVRYGESRFFLAAYIVAEPDAAKAVDRIRTKVAGPADAVEDLGRVSEALLAALQVAPGDFVFADGRRVSAAF